MERIFQKNALGAVILILKHKDAEELSMPLQCLSHLHPHCLIHTGEFST